MERLATTAAGFFDAFEFFETLDPDRPVVADAARNLVLDVVPVLCDVVCDAVREEELAAAV